MPLLRRSKGAIVNNLSLMALAPLPLTPAYAISKAAAFNMTQSLRALLAGQGVTVHGVFLGPIDTDMTRGFEIPKASPEVSRAGHLRRIGEQGRGYLPRPGVPVHRRGLAHWRSQGVRAPVRRFRARESGSSLITSRMSQPKRGWRNHMKKQNFTTTFSVDQTPEEVFDAINNVRGWWSEEIDGRTDKLGAEFKFHYKDLHRSTQKITEFVPGKKVVWHVLEADLTLSKTRPSGMAPTLSLRSPRRTAKPKSALRTSAWFQLSNATVTVQAHGAFTSTTVCAA